MVIGSVLLQPRKIDPAVGWETALLDDALTLAMRLAWDQTHGGRAIRQILAAGTKVFADIAQHTGAGRDAAIQKFQTLLAPLRDRLTAAAAKLPGDADPQQLLAGGGQLFALIGELAQTLTVNQVRELLDQILTILTQDLGFTTEYVQAQVSALFEEAVRQLRAAPPTADDAARLNRNEIAALLRRIHRETAGLFVLPPINADKLAGPLFELLRKTNYDQLVTRVSAASTAAKDALTAGGAILDLVPFSAGFGGGAVGAADPALPPGSKKLWYASWLTGDDIRGTDRAKTKPLDQYTFGSTLTPNTLETFTYIAKFVVVGGGVIFTLITGMQKGKFVNTLLQVAYGLTGIALAIWADYDTDNLPCPVRTFVIPPAIALIANFEGRWFGSGDAGLYFFRLFYNVLAVMAGLPIDKLRDFFLSLFTHCNYQSSASEPLPGDADSRPLNRNKFDAFLKLAGAAGPTLHAALIPHNYFSIAFGEKTTFGDTRHPFGTFFANFVFGSLGFCVIAFFSFGTLGACLPPVEPEAMEAFKAFGRLYLDWLSGVFGFFYLFNDGKTDDGKRGYLPDEGRGAETEFPGYPDPAASPYRLPYQAGDSQQCIQGNHGIWSHNSTRDVPLDFAFDFSMSRGTEVLAMRAGTVVEVVDDIGDDDNPDGKPEGNHIIIRHDALKDIDRSERANPVVTYALYMHGAKGSIAAAFGGLPAAGAGVPRGKVIMKVASSGDAKFNLLHVDVRPDNGHGQPDKYTIPFAFGDEDVKGDNGVPGSQKYYTSDNQKV